MYQIQLTDAGQQHRLMGDYAVRKFYDILDQSGKPVAVSGAIVQLVNKQSHADTSDGPLDSSDAFSRFTSGKVNYMCDSYIELFAVRNGKSVSGDEFASGAVARYEGRSKAPTVVSPPYDPEDEPYKTSGNITHVGTNVFFSSKMPTVMQLPWVKDPRSPANGLPYLPASYWPQILSIGNESSNAPVHTVTVTWGKERNESVVKSVYTYNAVARRGGRRRKTHKKSAKRVSAKRNLKK